MIGSWRSGEREQTTEEHAPARGWPLPPKNKIDIFDLLECSESLTEYEREYEESMKALGMHDTVYGPRLANIEIDRKCVVCGGRGKLRKNKVYVCRKCLPKSNIHGLICKKG